MSGQGGTIEQDQWREAAMPGQRNGHGTPPTHGEEMTGASSLVRSLEQLGVEVV